MHTSFKHKLKRFFTRWWVITGIILIALILYFMFGRGPAKPVIESATVKRGDVIEKVSVTGKVSPIGKADLAFQKGGVVSTIKVKVGDHVKAGDVIASLDSAGDSAALKSAQAQLADLTRGLRPEEYANDQAAVTSAQTSLTNAQKSGLNALRDGYVKAQSAIVNYADQFFNNPQSTNPSIKVRVETYTMQISINNQRVVVTDALSQWKKDIDSVQGSSNVANLLSKADGYLATVKDFMGNMSLIINDLSPNNSGLTQAEINSDIETMNTGLSTLTSGITAITTAETTLKSAQSSYDQAKNQFALQQAGSSAQTIAAQSAKVDQAKAELAKDFIVAPLSGIITKVVPDLGEFVTAGETVLAVQSDGSFKIEANVAEADIAKVSLGNMADVTLDAYGQDVIFPATVTMIDPAETILEGVPTYKVTLQFVNQDDRIRSGMTANTDILTHQSNSVLYVPTRAVVDNKGNKAVRILHEDDTFDYVNVVTGLKGSDGTIEIKSGLKEGEKVVTYVK